MQFPFVSDAPFKERRREPVELTFGGLIDDEKYSHAIEPLGRRARRSCLANATLPRSLVSQSLVHDQEDALRLRDLTP